jgi:amidase
MNIWVMLTTELSPVGYTGVYNVLDYAAMSFPTGVTADQATDMPQSETYQPLSELDKVIQSECKFQR